MYFVHHSMSILKSNTYLVVVVVVVVVFVVVALKQGWYSKIFPLRS